MEEGGGLVVAAEQVGRTWERGGGILGLWDARILKPS